MVKKLQQNTSKSTSLFEIRLKNLDHDVLVLKGNPQEAASALLSGTIVISVIEPISIKKISLRLFSTLKLDGEVTGGASGSSRIINFSKKTYEYIWNSQEFSNYLNNHNNNPSQLSSGTNSPNNRSSTSLSSHNNNHHGAFSKLTRNHSSTSLLGLRSKSSLSLSGLTGGSSTNLVSAFTSSNTNNNNNNNNNNKLNHSLSSTQLHSGSTGGSTGNTGGSHLLVQGNYEIPFSVILPGDLPESIEGLPGCSNVYRLEAIIDRGKFHSSMIAKKRLRIIRTLTSDAVELSETIAVDNTWPNKVEYSLSCPTKAIAIGSSTPITMTLVPLLKGLQLGDIKIELIEMYSFVGSYPPMKTDERIIAKKKIPKRKKNSNGDEEEEEVDMFDQWQIDTIINIPSSLSKCTQDVDLSTNVRVRHKLKFNIGLINPDGHTSELRATLPIQLFISPFVTVRGNNNNSNTGEDNNDRNIDPNDDDILFTSDSYDALSALNNNQNVDNFGAGGGDIGSNNSSMTNLTGLLAPPMYERHIYDRLWSDISPVATPLASGPATPRSGIILGGGSGSERFGNEYGMSPLDSQVLTENLRQLSLQRQKQEQSDTTTVDDGHGRATFNLMDNDDNNSIHSGTTGGVTGGNGDYFTSSTSRRPILPRSNQSFLQDHMVAMSTPVHISRVNSDINLGNNNNNNNNAPSNLSPLELSQVPSYAEAMNSDPPTITNEELFSPAYEPPLPGSHINLQELNKNLTNLQQQNNNKIGRHNSFKNSNSFKLQRSSSTTSRNSSQNSSPMHSRTVSSNNLSSLSGHHTNNSHHHHQHHHSGATSPSSSMTNLQRLTPAHLARSSSTNQSLNIPTTTTSGGGDDGATFSLSSSPNSTTASTTHQSVGKLSNSAADRTNGGATPIRTSSSLSLHNLHFLSKKKK